MAAGNNHRRISHINTHQIMPPLAPLLSLSHLPITPLSLDCQGLSSPPTCRHCTAIAAPKQIPPAQTPPQHPTSAKPHRTKQKKKLPALLLISPPPRLAPPSDVPPRSSKSATHALGRPHAFLALFSQGFTQTTAAARVSTRPSRPSFCHTKPSSLISPVSALYTRAAEDSGPCRVCVSRLADCRAV